jgi:hypothetical protein
VPEPSAFKFGVAVEKIRRQKSPGINQISAELIKTGDRTILFETQKLINSIWNKEELPVKWTESIIVPIFKKGVKTECSNYGGLSLFSTTCKILSKILLSRLTQYAGEIIGDHQCGLRRNTSVTDHTFCIRQILEKKLDCNEAVHQVFINFEKAYDSVTEGILCNILFEYGIPMTLAKLIKMFLNETYSRVRVVKHLSDMCPIKNGLKQGDDLSPLGFNFVL